MFICCAGRSHPIISIRLDIPEVFSISYVTLCDYRYCSLVKCDALYLPLGGHMEAESSSETMGVTPHGLTPYATDSILLTLLFVLCDVYLQLSLSFSLSVFSKS